MQINIFEDDMIVFRLKSSFVCLCACLGVLSYISGGSSVYICLFISCLTSPVSKIPKISEEQRRWQKQHLQEKPASVFYHENRQMHGRSANGIHPSVHQFVCRSNLGPSVSPSVGPIELSDCKRFLHYCTCPTIRDCADMYPGCRWRSLLDPGSTLNISVEF